MSRRTIQTIALVCVAALVLLAGIQLIVILAR